jgi:hypothetical protein
MTWKLLPDKRIRPLSHAKTFEDEECKKIVDAFKSADMRSYTTNSFFYSYRLIEPDIWPQIYENITGAVLDSNVNNYGFKIQSISALYYVEFDRSQWMDWSMDLNHWDRETSKLSIHAFLNEDYEGGDFVIRTPRDTVVPRSVGMTTIFPSFLASKQEQPSKGIKRAIMGMVSGLPFS